MLNHSTEATAEGPEHTPAGGPKQFLRRGDDAEYRVRSGKATQASAESYSLEESSRKNSRSGGEQMGRSRADAVSEQGGSSGGSSSGATEDAE